MGIWSLATIWPRRRAASGRLRGARVATSAAVIVCGLVGARTAAAQSLSLNPQVLRSIESKHPSYEPFSISRAECESEDEFSFVVTPSGFDSNYTFEVYSSTQSGVDCKLAADRTATNPVKCTKRDAKGLPQPNTNMATTIKITAQEIAEADSTTADCGQTTKTGTNVPVTLWFLLTKTDGTAVGVSWPTKVDVWGPAAPTNVKVSAGDQSLKVDYTPPSEVNTDVVVYCDVPSSGGGTGGGGGSGGSGGGTAGGSGASCTSSTLKAGELPDPDVSPCAEGSTVDTFGGKPLENDKTYVLAVAATDVYGNAGPLAELVCGTPIPIDDPFEIYKSQGGSGGGGFCAISVLGASRGAGSAAGAMVLGAAIFAWRRSKKRANKEAA